jgi:UDPglucose 6-dehydrogenase
VPGPRRGEDPHPQRRRPAHPRAGPAGDGRAQRAAGRLRFTTDVAEGVRHGLLQFIAVGTPPDEDGSADLQYVSRRRATSAATWTAIRSIVDKSTVPVGTADGCARRLPRNWRARGLKTEFSVVSNPEFLKEGAAVEDFMRPDRIVVGADDARRSS